MMTIRLIPRATAIALLAALTTSPGSAAPDAAGLYPASDDKNAPQVAAWSDICLPGQSFVASGVNLDSSLRGVVFGPRGQRTELIIHSAENDILSATVPDDVPAGLLLVQLRNRAGWCEPFALNRASAWWSFPDRARSGEEVRIFGRNLYIEGFRPRTKLTRDNGETLEVETKAVDAFEVRFRLPDNAPPGAYVLSATNGSGGDGGWSDPIKLSVIAPSTAKSKTIELKPGSMGDDTDALAKALKALEEAGGGTLRLSEGLFKLKAPLQIPADCRILGAGMGKTVLQATNGAVPLKNAYDDVLPGILEVAGPRVEVADLTLRGTAGTANGIRAVPGREGPKVEGLTVRSVDITEIWGATKRNAAIRVDAGRDIRVLNCRLNGHVAGRFYRCRQVLIRSCDLMGNGLLVGSGVHDGGGAALGMDGCRMTIVEGCDVHGEDKAKGKCIDRFISFNLHLGSEYHNVIRSNRVYDMGPAAARSSFNVGEQIIIERGSSVGTIVYQGRCRASSPTRLEMLDDPRLKADLANDYFLVIAGGRGVGQIAGIVSNTTDTIELARPLRVLPNDTTVALVARINYRNLILDNDQDAPGGKASVNLTLYYAAHENIVAGNYCHGGRGGLRLGGGEWPGRPEPVWPKQRQAYTAYPSYFNYCLHNRLDGTGGIRVSGATQEYVGRPPTTVSVLGAIVRGNQFSDLIGRGVEVATHAPAALARSEAKKVTAGVVVEDNAFDAVYGAVTIGQRVQHAVIRRNFIRMPTDASAEHVRGIAISPEASCVTIRDNRFEGIAGPLRVVAEPLFPDTVLLIDGETPYCPLKPTQQRGVEVVHWFDAQDKVSGKAAVVMQVRGELRETDKGRGTGKAINIQRRDIAVRGGDTLRFHWDYKSDASLTCAFSFHGTGATTRKAKPGELTRNIRFSTRNFGGPMLECPAMNGQWRAAEQILKVPAEAHAMRLTIMVPHATTFRFDDLRIERAE